MTTPEARRVAAWNTVQECPHQQAQYHACLDCIATALTRAAEEAREAERTALDAYEACYRRLMESSAQAKLDSDVWYALTKAHDLAAALRQAGEHG